MATHKSPLSMFYQWESTKADTPLFTQPVPGRVIHFTWKEAGQQVRRMASAIQAMNLPARSKIGLVSKNCAHWIMADLAIMMSGHISVPVYPNVNAETINYVLTHSESKLLFVGKLDDWASMKSGVPAGMPCISFPDYYGDTGFDAWDDVCAKHEPMTEKTEQAMDEMMTIIYTSGTTGQPKGVVQTANSFAYAISNALTVIDVGGEQARLFSYLPLSHIAERMLVEMGMLYLGCQVFFAESLDTFAQNIQDARPSVFLGVPRIWTKFQMGILAKMPQKKLGRLLSIPILGGIVKGKIKKGLGLDKAQMYLTGAAPTPPAMMEWFKKLGITLQEVYGMTENTAYSHFNRAGKVKFGSAGQAMPKVDVKISDVGEILVKSDANMVGYYKEPEKTKDSFTEDGYLRTGDKGVIDQQGFLKITGRVKDIFKTEKGKYVSPSPIEQKLSKNKSIEQVCVIGSGLAQPMALVVLSEEGRKANQEKINTSLEETLDSVNPLLEKHEKLKKIIVVREEWTVENDLMTPTLKIKRSKIEDKYQDHYTNWYSKDDKIVRE